MSEERRAGMAAPTLANEVRIAEHIDAGIEAASEMVSGLPKGQQAWGPKEYRIAQIAAREAVLSYQAEASLIA
jgi:hypothetical protein